MPLLFAVTLFVSASLLFMVQPMVGKMILPLLGGSPAVWNACMVFFQALLLLGYLYAHHVSTRYAPRRQWAIHTLVMLLPVATMLAAVAWTRGTPIAVAEGLAPGGDTSPIVSVMALLTVAIGVPFLVASTSAPLLQKWFAYTGHPSARDPYFLYAASNAGSLISLLGYPLFIEPNLTVAGQAWLFAGGFAALVGLVAVCGRAAAHPVGVPPLAADLPAARGHGGPVPAAEPAPSPLRVAKWVVLAFVPSSLMLGVTFTMTTDIASVPLLWVIPLALYLVTFIIAFGRVPPWFRLVIGNLAPVALLLLVFVIVGKRYVSLTTGIELFIHIAAFFALSLMCHYELARDRPKDVAHLTGYFLCMSVGGVLGGVFNALVAPVVFPLAYEYPLTLVVAAGMVPRLDHDEKPHASAGRSPLEAWAPRALDLVLPATVGLVFWLLAVELPDREPYKQFLKWVTERAPVQPATVVAILSYAVPVMACFFFVDRPVRFALSVAVLLGIHQYRDRASDALYVERSFFGILKVEEYSEPQSPTIRDEDGRRSGSGEYEYVQLVHGTTLHGTQVRRLDNNAFDAFQCLTALNPWDNLAVAGSMRAFDARQEPLTYYHRTGPVGAAFHELRTRKGGADATAPVAMIGLGTGSVSCYALPGQKLTFYEIDPAVRRIVETPEMVLNPKAVAEGAEPIMGPFTFVADAKRRGATVDFKMGDARLKLRDEADARYALLLVDAFSSDSIPVHLLTKQAVELYLDRLTPDGILALHISNKYVELEPVVARIAEVLHLSARVWSDNSENRPGKTASSWVMLAREEKTLGSLAAPVADQAMAFGTRNLALIALLKKYGPAAKVNATLTREYGPDYAGGPGAPEGKKNGLPLDELRRRYGTAAAAVVEQARGYDIDKDAIKAGRLDPLDFQVKYSPAVVLVDGKPKDEITLADLAEHMFGRMYHPVKVVAGVPLWTDDYSDVLRVMRLKEVQAVRKFFNMPTPIED